MADNRLAFGGVSDMTLHRGGSTSTTFIRFNADTDNASNVLTNVSYNNYNSLELIRVGQYVYGTTLGWTDNRSKITGVNLLNGTITVEDIPSQNLTNKLMAIQLPKGQIFVESGSFTAPTFTGLSFRDITGSNDPEFQLGDNKWGVLLQLALTSSDSSIQAGKFAQYEVTEFTDRTSNTRASFYVTASTSGILEEPSDKIPSSLISGFPIFEVSITSSLGPIFAAQDLPGSNVNTAAGFASYQTAIQDYLDTRGEQLDILYTGSLVGGNISSINFSGSGIEDITVTSEGNIEVKVKDLNDPFPYTGSAIITGSLGVTGSVSIEAEGTGDIFLIKSSSIDNLKVNEEGVVQLFAHPNDYTPTPVLGGIYFTSASAYLGLE